MAVIIISRGTFSGGKELAEAIAWCQGIQCLSREVIGEAADEYGVSVEALAGAMDRPPPLLHRISHVTERYVAFMRAALCEHALSGDLVYHGTAGHLLLTGVEHVVRVRVLADMEFRITSAIQELGLSRKQAVAHIRAMDKARTKWARFLYGVDWADASLYDLVINLEHVGVMSACNVVCTLAEQEDFQPTEASMRAMANLALSSRVTAMLARDPKTMPTDLKVLADEGVVTIEGKARVAGDVEAVEKVVAEVEGVKTLHNHVVVRTGAAV